MSSTSPFSNTETAFKLKSNSDLKRAEFLFSCIKIPSITKIGTAVIRFAIRYKLPFAKMVVKKTLFKHFCGGETMQKCLPVVQKIYENGVYSVLDYSVEGKEVDATFDNTMLETLKIVEFAAKNPSIPLTVFKPTGLGRLDLYAKVSTGAVLSRDERMEWDKVVDRYYQICEECYRLGVPVMIDAEESWMQQAVDDLTEELMRKFNSEKCIVWGTIQMYRTGMLDFLKSQKEKAEAGGYLIGFKIVRGAYMEKERARAQKMGYPSPIQPDKESTDRQYDEALEYMVKNIDRISLYAGTHNERSNEYLMELIDLHLGGQGGERADGLSVGEQASGQAGAQKGGQKNHPKIWFGQLYGMSDNISFNLGHLGYNVTKYLPYGAVGNVVPYLLRRAEENTSVAGQTGRELAFLRSELQRRKG
ncbi:MAG: proline dehydrogenase family protein [Bacteroidales bacterium]|jgi:proline dehydrogenase|nr:proline dehydrogenase family protein [Bacteroidales bacterium]